MLTDESIWNTGGVGAEVVHSIQMTAEKQPRRGQFSNVTATRWLINRCGKIRLAVWEQRRETAEKLS